MGKLHIKTTYGIIPNHILLDTLISLKAKGLFVYIQSKPDGWDFSAERIARQLKECKETVNGILRELVDTGYLKRDKQKNGKIDYWLTETKNCFDSGQNDEKKPKWKNPTLPPISNKDNKEYNIYILDSKKEHIQKKEKQTQFQKTNPSLQESGSSEGTDHVVQCAPKLSTPNFLPKEVNRSFFSNSEARASIITGIAERHCISQQEAEDEVMQFVLYWTEPNGSGTKQRWELQKTFDIARRLGTWFRNKQKFNQSKVRKIAIIN